MHVLKTMASVVPVNAYTQEKYARFEEQFRDPARPHLPNMHRLQEMLQQLMRQLGWVRATSFEYLTDNAGRQGNTADVVLHAIAETDKTPVYVSLKLNNSSIKHPCPSNFAMQAALSRQAAKAFSESYRKLVDSAYASWKEAPCFSAVARSSKFQLYRSINELVASCLQRNHRAFLAFLNFLLNGTCLHYIVHCRIRKRGTPKLQCICMKPGMEATGYALSTTDLARCVRVQENHLWIELPSLRLDLRLHTASSSVRPSLRLKYDVLLKHVGSDFPQICLPAKPGIACETR